MWQQFPHALKINNIFQIIHSLVQFVCTKIVYVLSFSMYLLVRCSFDTTSLLVAEHLHPFIIIVIGNISDYLHGRTQMEEGDEK